MQSTKTQELSFLEAQEEKKSYLHSDLVIGWQYVQVQYSL